MGEPVRILDLAISMIEMAGLEPYTDIPIQFVGLRPGEKLYEELLLDTEGARKTKDDKIYVAHSAALTNAERRDMLDKLHRVIAEKGDMKAVMREIVPDYKLGEDVGDVGNAPPAANFLKKKFD
jgi:FlaA1/EpsC-like NDP-sugar epimerase